MPTPALAILAHRVASETLTRAVALAEIFTPDAAASVGFLDAVVEPERTVDEAVAVATRLASLDRRAYQGTKSLMRSDVIAAIRIGIEHDYPLAD